ncbi:hypothetical protein HNY73_013549 [Argiope bruennichi]|uniref:Uncharacterized protein n=1 Tax=Argiope bruennichi TaxID=94029 RepID=A0A8T0F0J1_ARGBR|nr:hypothetical protein HNY73_013549 [Argiope bruennichi]
MNRLFSCATLLCVLAVTLASLHGDNRYGGHQSGNSLGHRSYSSGLHSRGPYGGPSRPGAPSHPGAPAHPRSPAHPGAQQDPPLPHTVHPGTTEPDQPPTPQHTTPQHPALPTEDKVPTVPDPPITVPSAAFTSLSSSIPAIARAARASPRAMGGR